MAYNEDPPVVGKQAQKLMSRYPKTVTYDAKRMIGLDCKYSGIEKNKEFWIFDIKEKGNRPVYDLGDGRMILPEEVSSEVLKELKRMALKKLNIKDEEQKIKAVISVPDYFNQAQKQGTLKAASLAGIDVLNLVTEPNAAALAYGYDQQRFRDHNIFVFDMGGGTTDISILKVEDHKFKVVATVGDNLLGGRDIDNLLLKHYTEKIKDEHGLDIFDPKNIKAKIRLREVCETVKKDLGSKNKEM